MTGVAVTPSHIVMKCGSKLYSIPKGKRINTLDNFTALTSWGGVAQMTALSPDKLLLRRDTRGRESLYTLSFNGNSASGAIAVGDPASSSVAPFIFTPDGKVRYVTAGALWGD